MLKSIYSTGVASLKWSYSRVFGSCEDVLCLPIPPPAAVWMLTDLTDSGLVSDLKRTEKKSIRKLKFSPAQVSAVHVFPYPGQAWGPYSQHSFDPLACTNVFTSLMNADRLRFLRIDTDLIQLPIDYLKNFPMLDELHITSTLNFPEIGETPITKLTVIQSMPRTAKSTSSTFPLRMIRRLQHLHLDCKEGVDMSIVVDFDSLPSLECLCLEQKDCSRNQNYKFKGVPSRIKTLSLDGIEVDIGFINGCENLQHLRLQNAPHWSHSRPIESTSLQTLELVNCSVLADSLQNARLPALRCFLEYGCLEDMGERSKNPLKFLNDQSDQLRSLFAIYATRQSLLQEKRCNEVLDMYTLRKGQQFLHQYGLEFASGGNIARRGDEVFRHSTVSCQLLSLDSERTFIQTRKCAAWERNQAEARVNCLFGGCYQS